MHAHDCIFSQPPPLVCAGSPAGGPVFAPAAAPTGSTALQEGAMTFMTAANATARAVDPATGLLVSASSLAATQASGTIYTNQVWDLRTLHFSWSAVHTCLCCCMLSQMQGQTCQQCCEQTSCAGWSLTSHRFIVHYTQIA